MIKLTQPIIVEGKYDKITLENIVDTLIITTNGFSIFKDSQRCELIRTLAQREGVIVMTDSDSAGNLIRSHIKNIANGGRVINICLPQICGKERRKSGYSKEGFLGVEGIDKEIIEAALEKSGVLYDVAERAKEKITKTDMYLLGLSGGQNSSQRRKEVLKALNLPQNLSPNVMLDVVNTLYDKKELEAAVKKCQNP